MEQYLYRFRTADRLLGKDATADSEAVPGELENLEIYFAPPDQLNDPLEGYREIFWSGDQIVWMNFFRHYLLVLALRSWQIDDVSRGVPLEKNLPTWQYPEQLDGIFLAAYQDMDELLQSDNVFHSYAKAFAKNHNKHYKPQLTHYLFGLHDRFLSIVLTINDKHDMTDVRHNSPPFDPLQDVEFHIPIIANIEKYGDLGRIYETYQKIALSVSGYEIKYHSMLPESNKKFLELTNIFAARYLDQIQILMHPQWYVACFMKECDNSAIWGSYGDNHKGICLKYSVSGSEPTLSMEMNKPVGLGMRGITTSFQHMPFMEVFYDREHSEIDFFRSLGNVPNEALGGFWYTDKEKNLSTTSEWYRTDSEQLRTEHWEKFNFSLTSKLPQWESEKEYRLVLQSGMDLSDKKHRVLKYRFANLAGVIFGIKTPIEHKMKAINLIRAHCEREGRQGFGFYQAYYDPGTKSIQHALLPL
ncbi:DUF2971 domain-containing protein [Pseudomonas putida]|nr:DUF2971 domain-containing protein [Pseudomonas putida]